MDWVKVQNAFYPYEPIAENLDQWYVERPGSCYKELLKRLDPRRLPERYVLVGHRSSGKTTELSKLATELRKTGNYFVVYLPLEYNLDISKVNPIEVLFLIGVAVYKAAYEELPDKPGYEFLQRLEGALTTLVRTEIKSFSLSLEELLKGIVTALLPPAQLFLKALPFTLGTSVELVRKQEVQPQVKDLAEALKALIEEVERKARNANKWLILLVDGLDKCEDLKLIELNFLENPYLATVPCRAIYVGPMPLYYDVAFAPVRNRFHVIELPNIMIHDRERKPFDKGYETMRLIVHNRLKSLGYEPEEVILPEALDLLIEKSGGVVRDLVFLVNEAALIADMAGEERIDKAIAGRAVADFRRKYEAALTPSYRKVLEEVARTKQRTEYKDEKGVNLCDVLIMSNFILSYIDEEGDIWFDVHSVLW
jgi:hypothetical protein